MEVEILQENLIKGISSVSRFVAVKPSLPVLAMVLLKAKGKKVSLLATDMDTGIEVGVGARVIKEGTLAVPAKLMMDYVNSLPAGKLTLTVNENELKIVSGRNKAKITGMEASEFPEMPELTGKKKIVFNGEELSRLVRLVSFATLTEMTRPVLSAMLFKFGGKGGVEVVATDGYRLSLLSKVAINGDVGEMNLLVSSRVISEVERLAKEGGGEEIEMVMDQEGKSVSFAFGEVKLVAKAVEGEFPDYKKILPKEGSVVFRSSRDDLMEAVRLAAVFARESSNIVKWKVDKSGLVMSSNSSSIGEQESGVEGELIKGEEGKIAFNSKFLSELLTNVSEGVIEFSMNDALQPGLFKTADKDFLHVIMPVRVQGEE